MRCPASTAICKCLSIIVFIQISLIKQWLLLASHKYTKHDSVVQIMERAEERERERERDCVVDFPLSLSLCLSFSYSHYI
jgi:hypothetical protein